MSSIVAMTAKRVASPILFPRLSDFHRDLQDSVMSFPGYIKSNHYVGLKVGTEENLMFTFSEWEHKKFWNIWETSRQRLEIIDYYWDPTDISIKTFILNKPQSDFHLL